MERATLYLVAIIIISLTILGVAGEYFAYKYYSLIATQQQSQNQQSANLPASQTQAQPASSEKLISSFAFDNPPADGNIDQEGYTINITVPAGTDVTKLTPTIEISKDATISPTSGALQDFTNPVAYLVTAQDGSTQTYIAKVSVAKSNEKSILSFRLSGFDPEVDGTINETNYTVYAVVPDGTDLTKLMPNITVSDKATFSPASSGYEDFTNPVTYTVTAEDGSTQDYTITVVTESNSG